MTERPILFSAPMVRAILAGEKTQTRRVMKPQPREDSGRLLVDHYHPTIVDRRGEEQPGDEVFGAYSEEGEWAVKCPYGAPGDRLWVRETWRVWDGPSYCGSEPCDPDIVAGSLSRFDERWLRTRPLEWFADSGAEGPWRPSIDMPRWASRLTLEVTEVRVERLQEISEEDALSEGGQWGELVCLPGAWSKVWTKSPRSDFVRIWESINGRGSWDLNPWVWAITFRRIS